MVNVIVVNNTNLDIRDFDHIFTNCVKNNADLPDEFSDIFTLTIIDPGAKGILEMVED